MGSLKEDIIYLPRDEFTKRAIESLGLINDKRKVGIDVPPGPDRPGEEGKFKVIADHLVLTKTGFKWVNRLVIVEAKPGTYLSHITNWFFNDPNAAYDSKLIQLVTPSFDEYLTSNYRKAEIFKDGDIILDPIEPYYNRGEIPANYDENIFDPDFIYPGQRFALFLSAKPEQLDKILLPGYAVESDLEASDLSFDESVWDGFWFGFKFGVTVDVPHILLGASGGITLSYAFVMNKSKGILRYAWYYLPDYRLGIGSGGNYEAAVIALGHGIDDINKVVLSESGWAGDINFDLSFKLGGLGKVKWLIQLNQYRKLFKEIDKILEKKLPKKIYEEKDFVKKAFECGKLGISVAQALEPNKLHFIALPIPYANAGFHIWYGMKYRRPELLLTGETTPDSPEVFIPDELITK